MNKHYYEMKDDKDKRKALFPREVLPIIYRKESPYAKLMFEILSNVKDMVGCVEEVLQFGAKKYEPDGWKSVENAEQRYWNAFVKYNSYRDAILYMDSVDEESDLPHANHALCNLVFLLWFEECRSTPCVK